MDPSSNGIPAAEGTGQPAEQGAGASEQPSQTPPAQPAVPTTEPDFKRLYEAEKQRRAGLDRKISQLRKGSQQGEYDSHLTEDQRQVLESSQELQQLRVKQAERELQDDTKEIIRNYPGLPKDIGEAILANPRGFIKPSTQTVDEAVLDIEEWIANYVEKLEAAKLQGTPASDPKQVKVSAPNGTVSTPGKPDLSSITSVEQLDALVASGQMTEKELEDHMRELGKKRHSKS